MQGSIFKYSFKEDKGLIFGTDNYIYAFKKNDILNLTDESLHSQIRTLTNVDFVIVNEYTKQIDNCTIINDDDIETYITPENISLYKDIPLHFDLLEQTEFCFREPLMEKDKILKYGKQLSANALLIHDNHDVEQETALHKINSISPAVIAKKTVLGKTTHENTTIDKEKESGFILEMEDIKKRAFKENINIIKNPLLFAKQWNSQGFFAMKYLAIASLIFGLPMAAMYTAFQNEGNVSGLFFLWIFILFLGGYFIKILFINESVDLSNSQYIDKRESKNDIDFSLREIKAFTGRTPLNYIIDGGFDIYNSSKNCTFLHNKSELKESSLIRSDYVFNVKEESKERAYEYLKIIGNHFKCKTFKINIEEETTGSYFINATPCLDSSKVEHFNKKISKFSLLQQTILNEDDKALIEEIKSVDKEVRFKIPFDTMIFKFISFGLIALCSILYFFNGIDVFFSISRKEITMSEFINIVQSIPIHTIIETDFFEKIAPLNMLFFVLFIGFSIASLSVVIDPWLSLKRRLKNRHNQANTVRKKQHQFEHNFVIVNR